MKTIKEAAADYEDFYYCVDEISNLFSAFIQGVRFAEEWLPIERVKSGIMTTRQADEIKSNRPFLIKEEDGTIQLLEYLDRTYIEDSSYTFWRPLNRR